VGPDLEIILPANTVTITPTVSDDGKPNPPGKLYYSWNVVSKPAGTTVTFSPRYEANTTVTFSGEGTYTLMLIVDDLDLVSLDTLIVRVKPSNQPPVAAADGPYTANEGATITLDASGSADPDGDPLQYRWDTDNNGTWDTSWSSSPTSALVRGDDYTGTAKVEVMDPAGLTAQATTAVTFVNVAPAAHIDNVNQPNPYLIFSGNKLTFTASFTDPGWLDTHTSFWDFGDGTSAGGTLTEEHNSPDATGTTTVDKIYTRPGTYTVTLTIYDDDGGMATDSRQITVFSNLQTAGSLIIADRSKVYAPYTCGGTYSEVGADGLLSTDTLLVNGNLFLRSRTRLEGNAQLSGTCQRQDGTVITGTLQEHVPVTLSTMSSFTVAYGTMDMTVNNEQQYTCAPGSYRDVMVRARGRLTLSSGTYNFRTLIMEPDSIVVMNATAGPIYINVEGELSFGDRSERIIDSDPNNVFFYSNSTGIIRIGTDNKILAGSLIAPRANINVYSRTTISGAVCASQLRLEPDCTVNCGM
jgi:plastocyanin